MSDVDGLVCAVPALAFRRTASGWRVSRAQILVPFRMDGSLRAALDLEP